MIKNYIKTALRNLAHNKVTSLISIAGLAVGIGCFLLLSTYLLNELRYDRFHANADRIVRLIHNSKSSTDNETHAIAVTPTAPVPVFTQEFPDIADGVRVYDYTNSRPAAVQYGDKLFNEKHMLVADESFFKIFSFKFLKGNPATALSRIESVVITESIARKYFGNDDPMGKIMKVNTTRNMLVTGVIEDVPAYSQLKFDMMGTYAMMPRSKTRIWDSSNDYSYLLLKPGVNVQNLAKSINAYVDNLNKADASPGYKSWYTLEPLTKVHLYSKAKDNLEPSGNIKSIYILALIAVILLVLACINFLNLVTAKSIERAHEIGVRKVMGALRGQLFIQFITEAGMVTFTSLLVGVMLAWVSFPWFSNFAGNQLDFQIWNTSWLVIALLGLFVAVTFIAGAYPSLYLSAFNPVTTLKGRATGASGGGGLRKSLVVFQFAVSVFFITSTIIAGKQLLYIQHLDTGINRDQVVVLDIGGMPFSRIEAFKNNLLQQQSVKNISASYDSPVNVRGGYTINAAEGQPGKLHISITAIPVEINFVNTLGIKIIAGHNFTLTDEKSILDTNRDARKYSFIINKATASALGWKPEDAIGKRITMAGRVGEIRAVTPNFNFASLHQEVTPIVLFPEYDYFGKLLIKTSGVNMPATMDQIQKSWKSFYPNVPFESHFLDQEYEALYQNEQRTGGILTVFTLVTIFISCLGLFGLAVFSTRQRVREIGIRKVLGAGVLNLVGLLSLDFLKLVVLAVIISSPVAYYVMNKWLQDFVYRTHIQWWVFASAGGAAVAIAFLTVSYQSIKAAIANPVKSLRSE
ncbi:MAG: ABC transporter permease [Mucilaginibacter sp.]